MGADKAALVLGDKPMGAWVRDALAEAGVESVVMAGGADELGLELGLEVVADVVPGKGPMSALHALLTRFEAVAVVPCDVPLITPTIVEALIREWTTSGADVAYATCDGNREPLVSVWSSGPCLSVVEAQLMSHDLAIHRLFEQVTTCAVETDPTRLVNVNTADEFAELSSNL